MLCYLGYIFCQHNYKVIIYHVYAEEIDTNFSNCKKFKLVPKTWDQRL